MSFTQMEAVSLWQWGLVWKSAWWLTWTYCFTLYANEKIVLDLLLKTPTQELVGIEARMNGSEGKNGRLHMPWWKTKITYFLKEFLLAIRQMA